jgi:P-type Mg2+ transporter
VSDISIKLSAQLVDIATIDAEEALRSLQTSLEGLSENQSQIRLEKYGLNEIARDKPAKWYIQLLKTFQNPLGIFVEHSPRTLYFRR